MTVEVVQIPTTQVEIYRKGETGKSAYQEWLDLGNVGSVQDFLAGGQLVYDYTGTQVAYTHNLGRYVAVQCVDVATKKEYVADVEWLNLDTVIIRTITSKNLKIILK